MFGMSSTHNLLITIVNFMLEILSIHNLFIKIDNWNTLLKSDVTRRDHTYVITWSIVMDPRNVGSRFVNFVVNFIRDGTVFT